MDKKSFFKGLLSGVGASVLAFLVAVGVYSCSNPPKDNKNENVSSLVEDNRVPNRGKVRRLLSAGEYVSNKVYNGSYSGSITSADFGISGSISLGGVTCSYNLVNLNYDSSNLVRINFLGSSSIQASIGCSSGSIWGFGDYKVIRSNGVLSFSSVFDS